MKKGALIFEGNEKQVFATDHPDEVIFRYKDVTVAYNNVKRARFIGKGALNNQISAILLDYLNKNGVETHFIRQVGDQEQLCRKIEIIPLQVVVHNRIAGSLAYRLGVPEGFRHANTIVDLRYNNDELDDPLINRDHAVALGLASYHELDEMYNTARKVNDLLKPVFHKAGIELVDMKIEFGRASDTRHGRHHHLRRDQPRHLPPLGRGHGRADGQGPLPPGPQPRGGELYQCVEPFEKSN